MILLGLLSVLVLLTPVWIKVFDRLDLRHKERLRSSITTDDMRDAR